ncbi:MAG: S1 RNA-binding domain-containing protein [Chloroflexi bacterium]|nr:S1 RNA-binding domain-containing protein [Chloroflexota bacterium]
MGCNLNDMARFIDEATRRYQLLAAASVNYNDEEHPIPARALTPNLEKAWLRAADIFNRGEVVSSIVTGWNRGGLLVRWQELQGFVPASQLRDITVFECDEPRAEVLAGWVGKELALKIIELDKERNRLVFSERATSWGPHDGELLLSQIKPGETRSGQVSNLCDFGAFIDLGGIDGLVHLSELSWRRITHPRELLAIGQQVQVYVIDVDRAHHRVALSLKRLHPNPWSIVDTKYAVGQDVIALVTNIVDFGAFAQIEDGLEGLVHISELADKEIHHPSEVVHLGEQIKVRIVRIDSANNRLGLSIKQAQ